MTWILYVLYFFNGLPFYAFYVIQFHKQPTPTYLMTNPLFNFLARLLSSAKTFDFDTEIYYLQIYTEQTRTDDNTV